MAVKNLDFYAPLRVLLASPVTPPVSFSCWIRNPSKPFDSGHVNPINGRVFSLGARTTPRNDDGMKLSGTYSGTGYYARAHSANYAQTLDVPAYPPYSTDWVLHTHVLGVNSLSYYCSSMPSQRPTASGSLPGWAGDELLIGHNQSGDPMDLDARFAQAHLWKAAITKSEHDAIAAGQLNPADIAGHLDGWPLVDSLTSLRGALTVSAEGTGSHAPIWVANDNPTVRTEAINIVVKNSGYVASFGSPL